MDRKKNFTAGFLRENPVFSLYLGLCSTLAITTTLNNAIGMGVAVIAVLIMSNVIISLIRNITPNEIRIPVYIVVIAALVKVIQMLIQAYAPALDESLGTFIPLIVVNCIILGRAEAFASKNGVLDSALDGLGMGLGYTCSIVIMSLIREVLATGMISFTNPFDAAQVIFELRLIPEDYVISLFSQPFGAFCTFACLAAALALGTPDKTAICMLAEEKEIVWDVVTCVNQKNFKDLKLFKEFLTEMGVKRWRLFTIFPVGRAAEETDLQLTNEQFTWMLNFIRYCRQEGKIHTSYGCEGFLGNYEAEVRDSIFQCNAGISTASVLADGSISGCPSIRANFHQGNIYKDKFIDIWNNEFKPYRNREWTRKGQCADCKMFRYCEGNGMHLYDDNGNLLFCHYNRIK